MINTILIDDENGNINFLKGLLKQYCPQIHVLRSCNSVSEAADFILKNSVELVFLDVELKNELGFKLFELVKNPTFQVIFTTAHEKYALSAIKTSCLEYLLKPVNYQELIASVEKYERHKQLTISQKRIEVLLENIGNTTQTFQKIAIPIKDNYVFLHTNEIICCEANANYTNLYNNKGERYLSTKNLKEFEELLNPKQFFRCHKSWLINLNYIKKYRKIEQEIIMSNDLVVSLAVRKKDDFIALFDKM